MGLSLDGLWRKHIKEDIYNLGQSFWIWVDLFQFKDIMTVIFFSFPFSSEIFMEYLVSNQTDLPRIIKDTISQKWETIFWVPT